MAVERLAAKDIERVAVLGAGTIGASWTALFLAHGLARRCFRCVSGCGKLRP